MAVPRFQAAREQGLHAAASRIIRGIATIDQNVGPRGKGITNELLEYLLSKQKTPSFCGVYSVNKVPSSVLRKKRFSIVVNMSMSGTAGTHFVAIMCPDDFMFYYFDPYGIGPIQREIYAIKNRSGRRGLYYSPYQIQSSYTNTCALYCAYYILRFEKLSSKSEKDSNFKVLMRMIECMEFTQPFHPPKLKLKHLKMHLHELTNGTFFNLS